MIVLLGWLLAAFRVGPLLSARAEFAKAVGHLAAIEIGDELAVLQIDAG